MQDDHQHTGHWPKAMRSYKLQEKCTITKTMKQWNIYAYKYSTIIKPWLMFTRAPHIDCIYIAYDSFNSRRDTLCYNDYVWVACRLDLVFVFTTSTRPSFPGNALTTRLRIHVLWVRPGCHQWRDEARACAISCIIWDWPNSLQTTKCLNKLWHSLDATGD